MHRFSLAIGFCCLLASTTYAATDDEMKAQILKLLSEVTLKVKGAVNEQFCRQFLKDFETQDKIVHVEPLVQVDVYNDPALASFRAKCPKLRVATKEGDESSDLEFELNETVGDQFGNLWQGTAHFKLYKINLNNDAKDGDEYVFYYDRLVPKPVDPIEPVVPGSETSGRYWVVDFEGCEIVDGIQVDAQRQFEKVTKRPGYSGIIRYKQRFYTFDLYPVDQYSMTLWEYTKRQRKFEGICAYR